MAPDSLAPLEGVSRTLALARVRAFLRSAGVDEADSDGRLLLLEACEIAPVALVSAPDTVLTPAQAVRLADFAQRRAWREPATRIIGRRAFWSSDLAVRPGVLDPRADTEALVRLALRAVRQRGAAPGRILDLGSGSGAILCALLGEFERAYGVAVDLSPQACAATRENLRACGLAARASVVRGRWAEAISGPFDLIVSNPPYIPSADIAGLDAEVRDHDPLLALDGGPDGLDAYREIFAEAAGNLRENGVLAVEFGFGQGDMVAEIGAEAGLRTLDREKDMAGRERALAFSPGPA